MTPFNGGSISSWFHPGIIPILMFLVILIVITVGFRLIRNSPQLLFTLRGPQLLLALRGMLIQMGVTKKIDQKTLDKILKTAGYSYDPGEDVFSTRIDAWQRDMGYFRLYDEGAIISGMIIDCEPIYFEYAGKRWLIEFWKGQYGMTTGCEVGVYNTTEYDISIPEFFKGTFYESVTDNELLKMSFNLKKDGNTLLTRNGKHWWLTGFKLGEFSEPYQLEMELSITLGDAKMQQAFVGGLLEAGYAKEEIYVWHNTVSVLFDKPKTKQPLARTPVTDWVTQRKNQTLCETYREITDPYNNLLDKINAILGHAPDLARLVLNPGKSHESFRAYRTIENQRMMPVHPLIKRVSRVFDKAETVTFDNHSRFIIMSDCHRGNGSWGDDFSRNRNLYIAALNHYYRHHFTYIEIGDGDELWENKHLPGIINVHRDVFHLMSRFYRDKRLYMIFGNHDMPKQQPDFVKNNLYRYFDEREKRYLSLFEGIKCHEGLILQHADTGKRIFLIHGHQVDFLSYDLWKVARFLVRYLWRPLNVFGVNDPTSTAKNYRKKERVEKQLSQWVKREKKMLISGHTHRPMFPEPGEAPYFNGGSSIHPQDITGIEIVDGAIILVKWNIQTNAYGRLYIKREIIAGPEKLQDYLI